jgi:hypothetical protein
MFKAELKGPWRKERTEEEEAAAAPPPLSFAVPTGFVAAGAGAFSGWVLTE